jgi:hypothetical protein
MKFFVILFVVFSFIVTNAFSYSLNDTFQVNKQSEGYILGWNLSWAENCNQYGYYNKFWKLYKKLLTTNNPKLEGIKQGWTQASQADESYNCSESMLKKLLTNTENLLANIEVKETKNSQETDDSKEKAEMKEFWKNVKVTTNIKDKTSYISSKTKSAEDKCNEIGFKKGTEKYGDCVLKMLELK